MITNYQWSSQTNPPMSNRKYRQYTLMHSVVCFYIKTELERIIILSVSMEHILINCTLHWLYTNVHVQCKSPYKYIKILHISLKLRPQDIIVLSPRRYYWTSYKLYRLGVPWRVVQNTPFHSPSPALHRYLQRSQHQSEVFIP